MPRNGSGDYTLPGGNPVVSATTITSNWGNATFLDIAAEITNSLARDGSGQMEDVLELHDSVGAGQVSTPALTFSGDPDTGLYRIAADNPAMAAGGNKIQDWTTTGAAITGTLSTSGAVTVTNSTANAASLTVTGGSGGALAHAIIGQGGSAGGDGLRGVANGGNAYGVVGAGNGTGYGGHFTAGATGIGVFGSGGATSGRGGWFVGVGTSAGARGIGGATNGIGLEGVGTGTGYGGTFQNGTASTGAAQQVAVELVNGNLKLSGTAPNTTVAVSNTLTPTNIVKAWAYINVTGSTPFGLSAGFNITSATTDGNNIRVTFASNMASTNYAVLVNGSLNSTPGAVLVGTASNVAYATISATVWSPAGGGTMPAVDIPATGGLLHIIILGAQ